MLDFDKSTNVVFPDNKSVLNEFSSYMCIIVKGRSPNSLQKEKPKEEKERNLELASFMTNCFTIITIFGELCNIVKDKIVYMNLKIYH